MNRLETITKVAHQVRQDLDMYQKKKKLWTKGLRGACATASYLIQQELVKFDIESDIVYGCRVRWGRGHVWLETTDFLIDITYTQFKADYPVVIINKQDKDLVQFYCSGFKDQSMEKIDDLAFFLNWPEDQHPIICSEFMQEMKDSPHLFR